MGVILIPLLPYTFIPKTMAAVEKKILGRGLLAAGILAIAFNLRPGLASVGPLVNAIQHDTGLSNTLTGLLTTLPLIAFGVISMFTSVFTRRWSMEVIMAAALGLLLAGLLFRVIPALAALFAGTFLMGAGIAFGNVLIPGLIKRDFPDKSGQMTSLYTGILAIGTSVAAGVSFPLAAHIGWRWALGVWAVPVFIALMVWAPQLHNQTHTKTRANHSRRFIQSIKHLGKNSLAWQVALFMGLQSLTFYVILAWLPNILQARGMSPSKAGLIFSLAEAMGIFGSLLFPVLAEKIQNQRHLITSVVIIETISLLGLIFPAIPLITPWALLIGFELGGSFSLALLFIVLRTSTTEAATELSGMAQSIGYILAAFGPALIGLVFDFSHTWTLPLILLLVVLFFKCIAGLGAARPRTIS
jgi:CP family cyanate transporter-like MFS transporter